MQEVTNLLISDTAPSGPCMNDFTAARFFVSPPTAASDLRWRGTPSNPVGSIPNCETVLRDIRTPLDGMSGPKRLARCGGARLRLASVAPLLLSSFLLLPESSAVCSLLMIMYRRWIMRAL